MRKLMLLVFFMSMMTSSSSAQEDYRLRMPSAEAYLTTIIENAEDLNSLQIRTILAEVRQRFGNKLSTASLDLLRTVFTVLFADMALDGYGYLPHQEEWERAKLLAWLRENDIDLAETASLVFDDYDIQVTAVDFSGDGQDEYILDVVRGCEVRCRPANYLWGSSEYQEFLVLEQEQPGEVYLIATPLPWLSNQYHYASSQSSSLKPLQIVDINDDGLPEWLMMSLFYAGRDSVGVRLYVLGWQDGQLIELTDEPLSYRDYTGIGNYDQLEVWSFNEEGESITIEQRVPQQDNWRCIREEITKYTWNEEVFELTSHEIVFPDTFECLVRKAESAVYAHDLETAVTLYEQALALDQQADYVNYIIIRLALAYAITDNLERAVGLLRELQVKQHEYDGVNVELFLSALLPDDIKSPSVEYLCLNAYNFFVEYPLHFLSSYSRFIPGRIDDYLVSDQFGPMLLPKNLGCDVEWLVNQSLEDIVFTIDTSPAEQVEQLGWPVSQTFSADLNSDGIDEWLVWLDSEMLHPALFVSDGDEYKPTEFIHWWRYSYGAEYPYPPGPSFTFAAVTLPDGSPALATLDYFIVHPYLQRANNPIGGGVSCRDLRGFPAELRLFQISEEYILENFFFTHICEEGENFDFLMGEHITGWDEPIVDDWFLTEQVFTWDESVKTFTRPPSPTLTPYPVEETLPSARTMLIEAMREYANSNFPDTLEATDSLLERTTDIEADELTAARYLRALALESLGRNDEALAEYIVLYKTAPESAWGMLATLHLEVVDGE